MLIASGDTTVKGIGGTERPTSLPIFLRQNAGPGLRGKSCASGSRHPPGHHGNEDPQGEGGR